MAPRGNRALIVGAPNMFKTTSIATWPRPIGWMSYPGEQGATAIPSSPDIIDVRCTRPHGEHPKTTWDRLVQQTVGLLTRTPPIQTFAGDGLFQLSDLALDCVAGKVDRTQGEKVDPYNFPLATKMVMSYIDLVMTSSVPWVVFTAWEGKESTDPFKGVKDGAPVGMYPHLHGSLSKEIMGKIPCVLYCEVGAALAPNKPIPARWRLRPTPQIRCAGIKIPLEDALKLPDWIPQDWRELNRLLNPPQEAPTP